MSEVAGREAVEKIVRKVLDSGAGGRGGAGSSTAALRKVVTIGVSSRHLHLQPDHVATLFGRGHKLTKMRDLLQPDQFACKETVTLIGPKGKLSDVRVLGPERKQTQIESSMTDLYHLGVMAPLRLSGNLAGSAPMKIRGPRGFVEITEGLIIAHRHLHIGAEEAARYGVKTGDRVRVWTMGTRPVVFEDVIVRAGNDHTLEFHLDTDESNAAGVKNGDLAEIIGG